METPRSFSTTEWRNTRRTSIFKTSLIGEKTAVLCGPSGNKFLFSNENKLVHTWWPRNIERIFPTSTSTREQFIKMRKLLPGFIKPDSLRNYVGVMDSIAREHLETHWECPQGGGRENIVTVLPLVKKFTFAVACRLFLSIDDPVQIARFDKTFRQLVAGVLSVPVNFPGTCFNRAIKAANSIRREIFEIIRRRKSVPEVVADRRDILAHMLTTSDENGNLMSELEIADKIIGLLIGGHDTASVVITFIVKYLSELPHIYDKVLEGEMLITDFTYAGFYIPKGWKRRFNTRNTTHKHEEYFPEPAKFDPTRFDDENGSSITSYTYVPFGGGPRMCPGKEYAKLEILVFVFNLVKKFKW
ncbi:hypothetical protein MIMGU_mgv1a024381mg [Erythranthe guttata]|uniref:Cytochrome P450 n=1 Tax=Erythranthe guttata TaxID=4155 RepID=A0A022QHZ6_ERYGU|nr:hypothetical protein MIMGU_mgv1a024381mg [Erythranthe guttata]